MKGQKKKNCILINVDCQQMFFKYVCCTITKFQAVVTMNNFQMYRHITSPGWTLGWVWAKKEVIWSMVGAQAVDQGDCTKFKGNIPHCCKKNPTVVDLLPGVPYNQQIANCCKAGVWHHGVKTLQLLSLPSSWVLGALELPTKPSDYQRISLCLVQDQATLVAKQRLCDLQFSTHLMVVEKLKRWVSIFN